MHLQMKNKPATGFWPRALTARVIILVLSCPLFCLTSHATQPSSDAALENLLNLTGAGYSGGMTRRHRDIASTLSVAILADLTGDTMASNCASKNLRLRPTVSETSGLQDSATTSEYLLTRLLEALSDDEKEVRDTAAFTLSEVGPALQTQLMPEAISTRDVDFVQGWRRHLMMRVFCSPGPAAYYRSVSPPGVFSRVEQAEVNALLLAYMFADAGRVWPDDMFVSAFGIFRSAGAIAIPKLMEVVTDDKRDAVTRIQAARTLAAIGPAKAEMGPILKEFLSVKDDEVRVFAEEALISLGDKLAFEILLDRLLKREPSARWSGKFCAFGVQAGRALPMLAQMVLNLRSSNDPLNDRIAAAAELGCLGSIRSIPFLTKTLLIRDWRLQAAAARALGLIGSPEFDAVAHLATLGRTHWSALVRTEANHALSLIAEGRMRHRDTQTAVFPSSACDDDCMVLHGLPRCDAGSVADGEFHVPGSGWFLVRWNRPLATPPPARYPRDPAGSMTTYYAVPDGWLVGQSERDTAPGLAHISHDGRITALTRPSIQTYAIVQTRMGLVALASLPNDRGDLSVLLTLARENGSWRTNTALVLPTKPRWHGFAPDGTLLIAGDSGAIAVTDQWSVAPVTCGAVLGGRSN